MSELCRETTCEQLAGYRDGRCGRHHVEAANAARDECANRGFVVCACEGCESTHCEANPVEPCARSQTLKPPTEGGGVTTQEAKMIGWRKLEDTTWRCPFCSDNEELLDRVFRKGQKTS